MKDLFDAIHQHPWEAVGLCVFILMVVDEIGDVFGKIRKPKK